MKRLTAFLGLCFCSAAASSEEARVAVASNFAAPMLAIEQRFEARTGHELQISFGASGSLYAQIVNGAPFDLFLSADQAKLDALYADEMLVPGTRFTYAVGGLVLWSADSSMLEDGVDILIGDNFSRLAIANPEVAPYGQAALDVLRELGLDQRLSDKLVMGENISQTYQFVASGNADLGFVALSQVMAEGEILRGSFWVVPRELYAPILQDAGLLKRAADNTAAADLVQFLRSGEVAEILRAYGYLTLASE